MKILVTVASKHGSTREIARAIADELRAQALVVDLYDIDEVQTLTGYDAVILGSAIYAGNWLPQAKRFAQRNADQLARLPVWVFSSGPIGAPDPQPHDDPARLAASLGAAKIRDHQVFVGKLDLAELGLTDRLIARAFHTPEGDFRDWDAIRTWAREIAAELRVPSA